MRIQFFQIVSSVGRALYHYRRGHGFNSCIAYCFFLFRLNFHHCFKIVFNCDDHLHLLICSSNSWHSCVNSDLVYHLDNQNFTLLFSCTFFLQPDEKSPRYFYQVPYKGSQYITVLLATPLNCCSQILLTFAILNNSTFARIALFPTKLWLRTV